ncbi:MAG: hypothetical protein LBS33_07015 [Streptococcaceae bacterium]|jgi:hypothetical protein|nr:hypothetical protein [Streptococcaceae bacterium]
MQTFFIEDNAFIKNHQLKVLNSDKKLIYLISIFPNQLFITLPNGTKLITTSQKSFFFENEIQLIRQQKKIATLKQVVRGKQPIYFLTKYNWLITGMFEKKTFKISAINKKITTFKAKSGVLNQFSLTDNQDLPLIALLIVIINTQIYATDTHQKYQEQILFI